MGLGKTKYYAQQKLNLLIAETPEDISDNELYQSFIKDFRKDSSGASKKVIKITPEGIKIGTYLSNISSSWNEHTFLLGYRIYPRVQNITSQN